MAVSGEDVYDLPVEWCETCQAPHHECEDDADFDLRTQPDEVLP